jgi:lipoic acid synthetase
LKKRIPSEGTTETVRALLEELGLTTVCQNARCPNIMECFTRHTATFMILGNVCTRDCGFCAVRSGSPLPVDPDEPRRVAEAVRRLRLRHAVITSVTRDDLPDGGASHFAATIRAIREAGAVREPPLQSVIIEVLTPDFKGVPEHIRLVAEARPDIYNHNVETVPRLYPRVRPQADYRRSLELLALVKAEGVRIAGGCHSERSEESRRSANETLRGVYPEPVNETLRFAQGDRQVSPLRRAHGDHSARASREAGPTALRGFTKSGLMVGLGETDEEVRGVMKDLRGVGCDILTIGQYLRPSPDHLPIARFVHPDTFADYERAARDLGFLAVASGPFVRSSYNAEHVFRQIG